MRPLRIWLVLMLMLLVTGCASEPVENDVNFRTQVERLNLKPGMTRAEVIEQLGPPRFTYKNDRITSYPIFEIDGKLFTKHSGGIPKSMQLMLRFSKEWRLERASLLDRDFYFSDPIALE